MNLLLGVGNELDENDNDGIYVAKHLKKENWKSINCGKVPESFTSVVAKEKPDLLVIADSARMGLAPGEVRVLKKEQLNSLCGGTHGLPLRFFVEHVEQYTKKVVFVGIQPNGAAKKGAAKVVEMLKTGRLGEMSWLGPLALNDILALVKDTESLPSFEDAKKLHELVVKGEAGGRGRRKWAKFCYRHRIYNVHNVEFVDALEKEIRPLGGSKIIEIYAGDGKLSYHLRKRGIEPAASDDYSLKMQRDEALVEKLSHKEAIEKYKPDVVIASWPNKVQIIQDVLSSQGVRHFVYIGEEKRGLFPKEGWNVKRVPSVEKYIIERSDRDRKDARQSRVYLFSRL